MFLPVICHNLDMVIVRTDPCQPRIRVGWNSVKKAIAAHLSDWKTDGESRIVLILGMLNSKEPEEYLRPFKEVVDLVLTVAIPGEPNALSAEDLVDAARSVGLRAQAAEDVGAALTLALDTPPETGRVLIGGSLYLAGTVLVENG